MTEAVREMVTCDLIRTLPWVMVFLTVGMTLRIVQFYFRAERRETSGRKGLLARHVWSIGLSYLVFLSMGAYVVSTRFGTTTVAWVLLGAFTVASILGMYALVEVMLFEHRRINRK